MEKSLRSDNRPSYCLVFWPKDKQITVLKSSLVNPSNAHLGDKCFVKYGKNNYDGVILKFDDDKAALEKQLVSDEGKLISRKGKSSLATPKALILKQKKDEKSAQDVAKKLQHDVKAHESIEDLMKSHKEHKEQKKQEKKIQDKENLKPSTSEEKGEESQQLIVDFIQKNETAIKQYLNMTSKPKGKHEIKPGVFIDIDDHIFLKRHVENPRAMVRELLTLLVDEKTLKTSTACGKGSFQAINADILKAIHYYVVRYCKKPITRGNINRVINLKCEEIRNPTKTRKKMSPGTKQYKNKQEKARLNNIKEEKEETMEKEAEDEIEACDRNSNTISDGYTDGDNSETEGEEN